MNAKEREQLNEDWEKYHYPEDPQSYKDNKQPSKVNNILQWIGLICNVLLLFIILPIGLIIIACEAIFKTNTNKEERYGYRWKKHHVEFQDRED